MSLRLYVWQRLSAALMVPMIAIHLTTIFIATSNGLSAADILFRTQGSIVWATFYGLFVLTASIHGAIGLRSVATDWTGLSPRARDLLMWTFGIGLIMLGLRAIAALVLS